MLRAMAKPTPLERDVTGAATALLIKHGGFIEEIIANCTGQDKRKLFCSTEPFHDFSLYRLWRAEGEHACKINLYVRLSQLSSNVVAATTPAAAAAQLSSVLTPAHQNQDLHKPRLLP